ncbi:ANTAR domain-containing protein [Streptomyces sp. NPDC058305]|uniref:ANTAR domain-containing protein n=1 Tax=Streptomyces sp. NPDC058305 TaxID=3346438 RepID=UPI0036E9F31D
MTNEIPRTAGSISDRIQTHLEPGPSGEAESPLELRNRRLARAGVEAALQVLLDRYRLASPLEGVELLRGASRRFNIKLHTLADLVVRIVGPDEGAVQWFPRRPRLAAPALPGLRIPPEARTSHSAVLQAALRRVLHIAETDMGNVQLAEHRMLRLEKHTGLNRQFTDFFAFVQDSTTACAQAARQRQQVTVKDVESADIFDEASRQAILQAGSRAAHSLPLVSRAGQVIGLISSHHEQPLRGFSGPQLTALASTGAVVGGWLHTGTVRPRCWTLWNTSIPPPVQRVDRRAVPQHRRGLAFEIDASRPCSWPGVRVLTGRVQGSGWCRDSLSRSGLA